MLLLQLQLPGCSCTRVAREAGLTVLSSPSQSNLRSRIDLAMSYGDTAIYHPALPLNTGVAPPATCYGEPSQGRFLVLQDWSKICRVSIDGVTTCEPFAAVLRYPRLRACHATQKSHPEAITGFPTNQLLWLRLLQFNFNEYTATTLLRVTPGRSVKAATKPISTLD